MEINNKNNMNKRFIYPMSKLSEMLTEEEIARMSVMSEFNHEDAYFHFDKDENFLESLNEEDIKFYNENIPKDKVLLMAA